MKKYEFTGEVKRIKLMGTEVVLRRIRVVTAFGVVKAGDIGGWIEKEENLSHDGRAWVYGDAWVHSNAKVHGDAWVYGDAKVYGNAEVYGNAGVYGDAKVCGDAKVYGNAEVHGNAKVYGNAGVHGDAWVCGNAKVYGDAGVHGNAKVYGNARVCGNAEVYSVNHIFSIGPVGSRNEYTTFYRNKNEKIEVRCGCFNGRIEEFLEKVAETHGENKHASVYRAAAEIAKLQIEPLSTDEEAE